MYAFISKAPQKLHIGTIGTFAVAILFFSVSTVEGLPFVWVFQLVGLLFGGLGVYMLTRYGLRVYLFEITETDLVAADGQPVIDLTVTQAVGRKRTVVARVSLRDIDSVEVLSPYQARQKKTEWSGLTVFHYENTPFPRESCYITVPDEHAVLAIPPDPEMIRILKAGG